MSDKIYTVEEASKKTGISPRSISYYCKRDKVRKKSNRYQITSEMLQKWLSEMSVNGEDFARLQKDFAMLREVNGKLSEENQSLTEELSQVKDQMSSLNDDRDSLQDLRKAYDESLKTLEDISGELEQKKDQISNLTIDIDSLKKQCAEYESKLEVYDEVSKELEQRKTQVANLTIEVNSLEKQCTEYELELDIAEKKMNDLQSKNTALHSNLTKDIPHQEKLRNAIELITLEALNQNVQHKIFTDEEYNDIIGTLNEVEFQKEQVNYLRKRVEKQDEMMSKVLKQISERNFIEAKEKGFDKD